MTDEPALRIAAAAFPSLESGTDQGEFIAPKMRALVDALAAIAAPCVDRRIIAHHAAQVHVAALHLAANVGVGSFEIGGDRNRGFTAAHARGNGLAYEVARLKRAAASGSLVRWLKAWAAASNETRRRIIAQLDGRTARGVPPDWVSFSAPGYVTNAPPARASRIAIARIDGDMRAVPAARRKVRRSNPHVADFIAVISGAFQSLTGRNATVTYDAREERQKGPLIEIIREIEGIYHFKLMYGATTSRFRRR